jgi:hypothetical protein
MPVLAGWLGGQRRLDGDRAGQPRELKAGGVVVDLKVGVDPQAARARRSHGDRGMDRKCPIPDGVRF